jgi:hypothetical protein
MSAQEVPADVAELLRTHIESYEALEAVLLLSGRPEEAWNSVDLGAELGMTAAVAAATLDGLMKAGLVSRESSTSGPCFRAHADERPLLDRLQVAYRDHRVQLMSLMTANALDRVRMSALRAFAKAFVVRNRHDDR